MNRYGIHIEVNDGEIEAILKELTDAQETISRCYSKLRDLGVLTIRKEATSGN